VDFKNTVLIMTSNLGSDLVSRRGTAVGFGAEAASSATGVDSALQDQLMRRLRESFRPEFLNRIDEIVIFRELDEAELRQVTQLLLEETRRRLHAQNVQVDFAPAAVDWIAEHGYQPEFGARPMRRTIQREVDNRLSKMLLDGQIMPGQQVTVGVRDGHLAFTTSPHYAST
jgi:ATP-dependent Clp protease ATP-binding subunit ClpC